MTVSPKGRLLNNYGYTLLFRNEKLQKIQDSSCFISVIIKGTIVYKIN